MKFDIYTKLNELIEWVSEPDSFDERVLRLKESTNNIPAFKFFIKELYNPTLSFSELIAYAPFVTKEYNRPINTYDYGVLTQQFLLDEISLYADGVEGKVKYKYSHCSQSFDEMDIRDVMTIISFMRKEIVLDRINTLVVKEAFGDEFLGEVLTPSV